MPTKKPKPDLVKAADDFARKYEDVFGDKDPQDIINELRGDGDVPGASMNSSGESAARERLTVGGEMKCKNCEQPKSAHLISGHIYCPISLGRACWYEPVDAATPALVEAREQWMEAAARELWRDETNVTSWTEHDAVAAIVAIIARHYAARAREVRELVKAVEEDTRQIDRTHRLQLALAPFAAKGETGNVAAQGEQHD